MLLKISFFKNNFKSLKKYFFNTFLKKNPSIAMPLTNRLLTASGSKL
jgi:hypothetical protein